MGTIYLLFDLILCEKDLLFVTVLFICLFLFVLFVIGGILCPFLFVVFVLFSPAVCPWRGIVLLVSVSTCRRSLTEWGARMTRNRKWRNEVKSHTIVCQ